MILTVTLNPALDVTYRVPRVELHASHRVREVTQLAGGKGINVASVLHQRGLQVVATGLLGGLGGQQVRADLDARGIAHDFAGCGGETRRSVSVVSETDGDATVFNEPGPEVGPGDWQAFEAHLGGLLQRLRPAVVVVSGSLPPGVPADACGRVVAAARAGGARTVVDTSGPALLEALAAGPDVVKPNREELAAATGERDPVAGARLLQRSGRARCWSPPGRTGSCSSRPPGRSPGPGSPSRSVATPPGPATLRWRRWPPGSPSAARPARPCATRWPGRPPRCSTPWPGTPARPTSTACCRWCASSPGRGPPGSPPRAHPARGGIPC